MRKGIEVLKMMTFVHNILGAASLLIFALALAVDLALGLRLDSEGNLALVGPLVVGCWHAHALQDLLAY